MNALRIIPEIDSKTAGTYYRTVEYISTFVQQAKQAAEGLLTSLDHQSGAVNYKNIARTLSRLQTAKWIDRVSPGTYETMMRRITEDLMQHASELETRFMKVDFSLNHPENVNVAHDIIAKIELMSVLERHVPELADFRKKISDRFLQCTQTAFDHIQKTFNLQDKTLYQKRCELRQLEEIKKKYDNLHPARIFLQEQNYEDINVLNNKIEIVQNNQREEQEKAQSDIRETQSRAESLEMIIREYMSMSSPETDACDIEQLTSEVVVTYRKENARGDNYLSQHRYSSIEVVCEAFTKAKKDYNEKLQQNEENSIKLDDIIAQLERIKDKHDSLLSISYIHSPEALRFLQENKFNNPHLLEENIQERKKIISEREKNKQSYDFIDRLDAATANNALLYVNQCKKMDHDRVREIAAETDEALRKYLLEYGNFRNQEITENFKQLISNNATKDNLRCSSHLEMRLQELLSLRQFERVFDCIDGKEKVLYWQQQFLEYHHTLAGQMEEYKASCKSKELKDHLVIARELGCLDRFCIDMFGDNGFRALHKQYQVELTKECKAAYKTVLEYISKGDYANADIELSGIDDTPLNPKAINQIKQDLQSSLNKLMKDTKSIATWMEVKIGREEETRKQMTEIKENMEKIRIAKSKTNIMDQIDSETRALLTVFDNEIDKMLSDILHLALCSVEKFLEKDSFSEAQQSMMNLNRIQCELAGLCTSKDVADKTTKLKSDFDRIIEKILERDFSDIKKYGTDSPKDLLAKLEEAGYTEPLAIMSKRISQNFSEAIEHVRTVPLTERSSQIKSLKYASRFLPEKMQDAFISQIEELDSLLNDQVERIKVNLDRTIDAEDENDAAIKNIGELALKYRNEKMDDIYKILCDKTLSKLSTYRTNLENYLNKQDMQFAVDIMRKIYKYSQFVGSHVQDVNTIYESTRILVIKSFENCSKTLDNISTIEHTETVEKAYHNMIIYICFAETFGNEAEKILPENILQNSRDKLQKMFEYINGNSQNFQVAIKDMNVTDLHKTMIVSKRWNVLLQDIKQYPVTDTLIKGSFRDATTIIEYADMIDELQKQINRLESQVNDKLISDRTMKSERERDEFFINLKKAIETLRAINSKFKDVQPLTLDIEEIEKELKIKIETIGADLIAQASKPKLTLREIDSFRIYYNHLFLFDKHKCLSGINVEQFLKTSEENVFETIKSLRKQVAESDTDVLKISDKLIKMKFFAENLPIFDEKMNSEIDETLKGFKEKHDRSVFDRLIMALEKEEAGARMISEHSCLSGEDWRKRREKMQNQDNLEYVLENLTGDDIAKDMLRSRYMTFSTLYYKLVSDILTPFNSKKEKEPNLDAIIVQTKHMMGTIIQTPGSVTWNHSVRDKIPEILAHIFAVWTLKNTQHYNAVRGFDEEKKYLLIPHVAQVIAIFRLLGIGYVKSERVIPILNIAFNRKLSGDLVNNLIEISTGEGKSVVIAVTACVFALMGVDVNCSCYSDVLSKRDMNNFRSVFEAFGIENYIQYGTFNKLCEQLLNEQCDVREKVRDMIENNKTMLPKAEIKAQTRPKVLLIDEVDVFLSDKFYGETYTPSLCLKDPSIKALLDSIWRDKTLKTLNSVKALAEYKDCASKYSNWIFLFDEAIKDMLAALQSFRSSTYIVSNGRIAYVEVESIVDNVLRGYDTVWAYYYEHEQKHICSTILEENVGLIINCGTFSYAEMPHDFAYIAGVSGTLITLAEQEKNILKSVYAVCKNTYMPSVYGKSNRMFNSNSDVQAVDQSEYFMRIRGEIDAVCNANRAILVFFEDEEKLSVFYNSSELSNRKTDVQIISEKTTDKEDKDKELYIRRASTIGTVTLLTRTFGRGTDFISGNPQLLANGGMHVLQTFFSKELSEEYQIKGRGARQGDKGSYGMILLDSDLEWVLGSTWNDELQKIKGSGLYASLNEARNARYESICGAKNLGIAQCRHEHQFAKDFMIALSTGNMEATKKFLSEQNRGVDIETDPSRTVLLMDATGSMSSLLSAAKETVCTMFERASTVLKEEGLRSDGFQMQFVVYRNYNCKEDKILQVSPWSAKGNTLRAFMDAIKPEGGLGEEAIEIGLAHAVKESQLPDSISQVILIGDAPANTKEQVSVKRKIRGEQYWCRTKFNQPTHYAEELERLKDKNIPVHTFYLASGAEENFKKIANETKGLCERLNIQSSEGAESLTNFVTKQVLRITDDRGGEAAVIRYEAKYMKKTFTS
ncbi:unnamed protein product [Adineta steineri]|uniref:SecA family profile domain-containing protein n=1 Tax=Adineta steineri TaxID=433720 RepID=A0A814C1P5_9BILA|nr:unnamed protein product [Adineta steineri]CAF3952857.1 unnamed protein product [Adineta steineri]